MRRFFDWLPLLILPTVSCSLFTPLIQSPDNTAEPVVTNTHNGECVSKLKSIPWGWGGEIVEWIRHLSCSWLGPGSITRSPETGLVPGEPENSQEWSPNKPKQHFLSKNMGRSAASLFITKMISAPPPHPSISTLTSFFQLLGGYSIWGSLKNGASGQRTGLGSADNTHGSKPLDNKETPELWLSGAETQAHWPQQIHPTMPWCSFTVQMD